MANQRIVLTVLACCSIGLLAGQTFSWARGSNPPTRRYAPPPPEMLRGLSPGEMLKAREQWDHEREQEHLKEVEEWMNSVMTEAWKRLLKVSDYQWKTIEPGKEKVGGLVSESHVGALHEPRPHRYFIYERTPDGEHTYSKEELIWGRHSKGTDGTLATPPEKMTEGQRIADALADLLEDPNSTDEQIRDKVDALQQARENARKAMPKAKQELAAVLTTPRQEAVFLLIGLID